jgi:NAD(P)-dependent dehydrogenase (short-subunit alcohol dehydrogenase family)
MPDGDGWAAAVPVLRRWANAVAAYRRAELRVAAHRAGEALLPAERRAFPCEDLEAAYGRVDSLRLAALRRLLRTPAPDLPALALKLELAVADSAWETSGCEDCLALAAADARRLSEAAQA